MPERPSSSGLADEKVRWEASIGGYQMLSERRRRRADRCRVRILCWVFDTTFRAELVASWSQQVMEKKLPVSDNFNFSKFLAKPTDVREWNIRGLPAFRRKMVSSMTTGLQLMIDPQNRANKWIKKMEGSELKIMI